MDKDIIGYCSAIAQARRMLKMGMPMEGFIAHLDYNLFSRGVDLQFAIFRKGIDHPKMIALPLGELRYESSYSWKEIETMIHVGHSQMFERHNRALDAYEIRTNLSRARLSNLMDSETWMNAMKAIELGFADDILEDEKRIATSEFAFAFSSKAVTNALFNKIAAKAASSPCFPEVPEEPMGRSVDDLKAQLNTIKKYI